MHKSQVPSLRLDLGLVLVRLWVAAWLDLSVHAWLAASQVGHGATLKANQQSVTFDLPFSLPMTNLREVKSLLPYSTVFHSNQTQQTRLQNIQTCRFHIHIAVHSITSSYKHHAITMAWTTLVMLLLHDLSTLTLSIWLSDFWSHRLRRPALGPWRMKPARCGALNQQSIINQCSKPHKSQVTSS